jgi:hypothetical protein
MAMQMKSSVVQKSSVSRAARVQVGHTLCSHFVRNHPPTEKHITLAPKPLYLQAPRVCPAPRIAAPRFSRCAVVARAAVSIFVFQPFRKERGTLLRA